MKIVGRDNLNRETVADRLLIAWLPDSAKSHAKLACDALNTFTCSEYGEGTFYEVVEDNYRLSRGMEDMV